jgi:hypothetical protein
MEAINARRPEYYNAEGMHAFMAVCRALHHGVERERRMEACTQLARIRTMVGALRYLRTTATEQIIQGWERRRIIRRYQMQHYILDLQQYVASLRQSIAAERALISEYNESLVEGIMAPPASAVVENPLTRLTIEDLAGMSEEGQISFEGQYLAYLHDEVPRLEALLVALRQLLAATENAADGGKQRDHGGLLPWEKRLSNVFPDNVARRLKV